MSNITDLINGLNPKEKDDYIKSIYDFIDSLPVSKKYKNLGIVCANVEEPTWKNIESITEDDIEKETLFWLSYKNIPFIGYFYHSYGGLNYTCANIESLPDGVRGYHMGSVKNLDGFRSIEIPNKFKND